MSTPFFHVNGFHSRTTDRYPIMKSGATVPDFPPISQFAQLAASSITELRDLLLQRELPAVIDGERAIAIKSAFDAQQTEISHLRLENSLLTQRQTSLIDASRSLSRRYISTISAHFRRQDTALAALQSRLTACVSALSARPPPAEIEPFRFNHGDDQNLAELFAQLDRFRETNRELANENSALKQRVVELTQSLKSTTKAKSVLNSANLELNSRIEELEMRITNPQAISEINQQQQIRELTQSLARSHEMYQERIKLLGEQLSAAMNHADGIKTQLSESQAETIELHRKLVIGSSELASASRRSRALQSKSEDHEREIAHQKEVISQIEAQKAELQANWQHLLEQHQRQASDKDIFLASLSGVFGCDASDVALRISDLLTELGRCKGQISECVEKERENSLLRSRNASLEQRLALANEQIEGFVRRIELQKSGKESEIVNQIQSDFLKLKTVNAELYNEYIKQEEQLFRVEKSLSQTAARLEEQQKANQELSERLSRFESYEFSVNQFAVLLGELSSRMLSSLTANGARQRQLEAVDSLVIELRQRHFSAERARAPWITFSAVLFDVFANDDGKFAEMLRKRSERFVAAASRQIAACHDRAAALTQIVAGIVAKVNIGRRPRKEASLFEKATKRTPAVPPKKFAQRSPLTPSEQMADGLALTPRLNPPGNFDTSMWRYG
jgi:septal ring factor EnvC (AmiA/AmiB activator)